MVGFMRIPPNNKRGQRKTCLQLGVAQFWPAFFQGELCSHGVVK